MADEKLRLIQCGVGGMGKAWRENATKLADDFEVVAIVDINAVALEEASAHLDLPSPCGFANLHDALDAVEADAILTVTPPSIHIEHAKLAFARGLHVLTEKPIADTLENAKRMVNFARGAEKQLLVAQNYRFHAPMQVLRRLVSEAPVGALGHGHLDFYIAADFTGTFRQSMHFPLLIDMAIHHLDLIRATTGRNIAQVSALSFAPPWNWYGHEPGLKMLLRLDDGAPFSYSGDWSALGRQTKWNGNWRLQCAEGSIHLELDKVSIARCEKWCKDEREEPVEVPDAPQNGQARLLSDFARAIRTNTPGETSGADNLWSFAAVMAGVKSAQEGGRAVDVAEMLAP
jgi:predicted dehydrogenase